MESSDALLNDLVAREAIRECLYRYCRGMDRCDRAILETVYWPDAHASQLDYNGDPAGLFAWAFPQIAAMDLIQHLIGNTLIQIDGDRAVVESTFTSYFRLQSGDALRDNLNGGRYLDRFERRNGEWRIAKRLVVVDWSRDLAGEPSRSGLPFGADRLAPRDVSYEWLD
jgi:hypothetical protein